MTLHIKYGIRGGEKMNYRQWKKNYKKEHGYNPPIEVDKRKQVKTIRNAFKNILIVDMVNSIKIGLAKACECISEAFKNISEALSR